MIDIVVGIGYGRFVFFFLDVLSIGRGYLKRKGKIWMNLSFLLI